jgi:hypothetical protein
MAQRVEDHCALDPCRPLGLPQQLQYICRGCLAIGAVLCSAPDLTGPEEATLLGILAEIADDIRLLKEYAERV